MRIRQRRGPVDREAQDPEDHGDSVGGESLGAGGPRPPPCLLRPCPLGRVGPQSRTPPRLRAHDQRLFLAASLEDLRSRPGADQPVLQQKRRVSRRDRQGGPSGASPPCQSRLLFLRVSCTSSGTRLFSRGLGSLAPGPQEASAGGLLPGPSLPASPLGDSGTPTSKGMPEGASGGRGSNPGAPTHPPTGGPARRPWLQ